MRISDYYLKRENLETIRALGFIRFVLIYSVVPVTTVGTLVFSVFKWMTVNPLFADSISLLDLMRVLPAALLSSFALGILMWMVLISRNPDRASQRPQIPTKLIWNVVTFFLLGVGAGSLVGVDFGIWLHREYLAPWEDDQTAYASAWYSQILTRDLYLNGEYPQARKALLHDIEVLNRIRNRLPEGAAFVEPESGISFCHVRLSLLEEAHGDSGAAADYWDRAKTEFRALGWTKLDRQTILKSLKARDLELPAWTPSEAPH